MPTMIGTVPGKMRHRVTLLRPTVGPPDVYGQPAMDFATEATVWGFFEALSGRELWQAHQVQADISSRVVIRRYTPLDIGSDWRVKIGDLTYELEAILPDPTQRIWQELLCREAPATAADVSDEPLPDGLFPGALFP